MNKTKKILKGQGLELGKEKVKVSLYGDDKNLEKKKKLKLTPENYKTW